MKLQSSYIFLKHPYQDTNKNGTSIVLGNNIRHYITKAFPTVKRIEGESSAFVQVYRGKVGYENKTYKVEFILKEVSDLRYIDLCVESKSSEEIVLVLNHIQNVWLESGIRDKYVEVISYDAVSEFYCNKISPRLNEFERNLRKLLFNIYILNFGKNYYEATFSDEIQDKIKGVINTDGGRERQKEIRQTYDVSATIATDIDRLQQFFYSLEFGDIKDILFTSHWTSVDKQNKEEFLKNNKNLSMLSEAELRKAFEEVGPKSDWERFFSNKITVVAMDDKIEQIRIYRNKIAHYKFFYKEDYEACEKLIVELNSAVLNAIMITEEKDFEEKNALVLAGALVDFVKKMREIIIPVAELTEKFVKSDAFALLLKSYDKLSKSKLIENVGKFAINNAISQGIITADLAVESAKPVLPYVEDVVPPYVKKTQEFTSKFQKMRENIEHIDTESETIDKEEGEDSINGE